MRTNVIAYFAGVVILISGKVWLVHVPRERILGCKGLEISTVDHPGTVEVSSDEEL